VGGFVLVGLVGWATGGLEGATTAVALFAVAGFRMAPSLVRFQAVVSQVAVNSAHAQVVVEEIRRSEKGAHGGAPREPAELADAPGELTFADVSFRYAADAEDAVRDVDLTIPFGSRVAFVGESGAGKSTMIDLLLGLIEPTGGTIAIDGTPLSSATDAWRSKVAYVPQDVSLFDSTVAQNVALSWSDDVDRDRVREALARAQLLETIETRAGGIDAMVGERGLALSGGQRQRLGIARALYVNPLVLVLDEATSALDTATEAAIVEALDELAGELTIISVAHRLATIKNADTIYFMSGGRVEAAGTFRELVKQVPEFAAQARLAGLDTT
jgi:ATP-binding cassette, subfamily B, bacterial PglK